MKEKHMQSSKYVIRHDLFWRVEGTLCEKAGENVCT